MEPFQSLDFYLNEIHKRDIFHPALNSAILEPKTAGRESLKKSAENLKLQGISWGDVPKVMLQGDKDSKFYILKEGQPVGSTGIRVKTILKNKVILTNGDKDVEL